MKILWGPFSRLILLSGLVGAAISITGLPVICNIVAGMIIGMLYPEKIMESREKTDN